MNEDERLKMAEKIAIKGALTVMQLAAKGEPLAWLRMLESIICGTLWLCVVDEQAGRPDREVMAYLTKAVLDRMPEMRKHGDPNAPRSQA